MENRDLAFVKITSLKYPIEIDVPALIFVFYP
jgi:hypothetical protein